MKLLKTHYNSGNKVINSMVVWACTENGRKLNSQKSIIYEFENNKTER
jgi:hypothetical protein